MEHVAHPVFPLQERSLSAKRMLGSAAVGMLVSAVSPHATALELLTLLVMMSAGSLAFRHETSFEKWSAFAGASTLWVCLRAFMTEHHVGPGNNAIHASTYAMMAVGMIAFLFVLVASLQTKVTFASMSVLARNVGRVLFRVPSACVQSVAEVFSAVLPKDKARATFTLLGLAAGACSAMFFSVLLAFDAQFRDALGHVLGSIDDTFLFLLRAAFWTLASLAWIRVSRRAEQLVQAEPQALGPYREVSLAQITPVIDEESRANLIHAWSLVLACTAGVFALFVVANLPAMFMGHEAIRTTHGVTYAEHLHRGFGSSVFACVLACLMVLSGHALFRSKSGAPREVPLHARVSESVLMLLAAVSVISCMHRLHLYVEAYGYTQLRVLVLFYAVSALGALVLTGVKAMRVRWDAYAGAQYVFQSVLWLAAVSVPWAMLP